MNKDINFMTSTNLAELLEEHKKITHPYKTYEFDSTSYILLLCDIKRVLKENIKLRQALNEIKEYIRKHKNLGQAEELDYYVISNDILQIIYKAIGDGKNDIK